MRAALLLMAHVGAYSARATRAQRSAFTQLDRTSSGGLCMEVLEAFYDDRRMPIPEVISPTSNSCLLLCHEAFDATKTFADEFSRWSIATAMALSMHQTYLRPLWLEKIIEEFAANPWPK